MLSNEQICVLVNYPLGLDPSGRTPTNPLAAAAALSGAGESCLCSSSWSLLCSCCSCSCSYMAPSSVAAEEVTLPYGEGTSHRHYWKYSTQGSTTLRIWRDLCRFLRFSEGCARSSNFTTTPSRLLCLERQLLSSIHLLRDSRTVICVTYNSAY